MFWVLLEVLGVELGAGWNWVRSWINEYETRLVREWDWLDSGGEDCV